MIWEGTKPYNNVTGKGAIGVEFAGTAVSSSGLSTVSREDGEQKANAYNINPELKWVEGYYRGYFELHLRQEQAEARYFGCPTVATRNSWELPLANWTVKHSESHLQRPLAGGAVEAGFVQEGKLKHSDVSLNTETGEWKAVKFDQMFLKT